VRTRAGVVAAALALVVGLPTLVSGQCPDGSPPPCGRRAPLDTTRYAILPFAHREGSQSATLDGADCAELLAEAFGRWVEVRLADKTRIYDALARRGARPPFRIPFDTALAIARALGAGKVVMGQLWTFGDTLRLTAGVYDAARGGPPVREVTTRVAANSGAIGVAFNALADSLLGADPGDVRGAGAEQTRSLRALRAYALGQRQIREWDLVGAASHFRGAVATDSDFAQAYLWLGQALVWSDDTTSEAARDRAAIARRAGRLVDRLSGADAALLLAQEPMFEHRWPDACQRYRQIVAADSSAFAGWYGLAECNALDRVVIRHPSDTARFTFRGGYETAVQAYRRALVLAPAFNLTSERRAIERLPRLLFAERWYTRQGVMDGSGYVAYPELEADTLAFYAIPGALAGAGREGLEPPSHLAAVARNRRILMEVSTAFADAFPDEPVAHRTLARALESVGTLEVGEPHSAIVEFGEAQRLERHAGQRARDAADRLRVLIKVGDFAGARRLGDSLLRVAPRATAGVAGVAVLLGQPSLARHFLATEDTAWLPSSADNQPVAIPLGTAQAGLALLAYAAAGAPGDSIVALERRLDERMAGVPAARRALMQSAVLDVSAELVFDALGLRAAHRTRPPGPRLEMLLQWRLAHGDTASVRTSLDSMEHAHGGRLSSGESTPDGVYINTRLLLALGDTATAERTLSAPLDSLVALHTATLQYMPLAGCLVRNMALRAELAAVRGDLSTARRWAGAVATLWAGAEPALRPTVDRMLRIVAAHREP
jgi:tetratricopeptide (TPR) repeat protein